MSKIEFNLDRDSNKNIPNGIFLYKNYEHFFGVIGTHSFCITDRDSIFDDDAVIDNSLLNISGVTTSDITPSINSSICNFSDVSFGDSVEISSGIINIHGFEDLYYFNSIGSIVNNISSVNGDNQTTINSSIVNDVVYTNDGVSVQVSSILNAIITNTSINTKSSYFSKTFSNNSIMGTASSDAEDISLTANECNFINTDFEKLINMPTNIVNGDSVTFNNSYFFNSSIDFVNVISNTNDMNYMYGIYLDDVTLDWALDTNISSDKKMVLNGDLLVNGAIKTKDGGTVGSATSLKEALFLKEDTAFDFDNWETATIVDGSYHIHGGNLYTSKANAYSDVSFSELLDRAYYYRYMSGNDVLAINRMDDNEYIEIALSAGGVSEGANVMQIALGQTILGEYADLVGSISIVNTKVSNNSSAVINENLVMLSSNGSDTTGTTSQNQLFITDDLVMLQYDDTTSLQFTDSLARLKKGDGSVTINGTSTSISYDTTNFSIGATSSLFVVDASRLAMGVDNVYLASGSSTDKSLTLSDTEATLGFSSTNYLTMDGDVLLNRDADSYLKIFLNSATLRSTSDTYLTMGQNSAKFQGSDTAYIECLSGQWYMSSETIWLSPTGDLIISNLPTSAPLNSNRIWNDGGVLKITS